MNRSTANLQLKKRISVVRSMARLILGVFTALLVTSGASLAQTCGPGQKTISLEELQQMALQHNPTLSQAAANIRAAEGSRLRRAQTVFLHELGLVGWIRAQGRDLVAQQFALCSQRSRLKE